MAQAVQKINPDAKLGIGPPIEDGFYYDFDVETPFTPDDLKAIEKEMDRIIRSGQRFVRRVVTEDEATTELAGEPYKLELIGLKGHATGTHQFEDGESVEVGGSELTIYDNVDRDGVTVWKDLCRGPHLPNTGAIGNGAQLMRVAAAYWRGSEKNKQLQRIYGTAWPSKDELRAYTARLEEALKRDHRKLGVELDLFSFPDEIGSGLAVFHPKGGIIRNEMEGYLRSQLLKNGYELVNTPHITKGHLFETSGHLQWYKEGMFPAMHLDEERRRGGQRHQAGAGLLPQAHELPDAPPDLPGARPQLSRAAAAAGGVRHRVPLREERNPLGPDPRARPDPGRRARLRDPRADPATRSPANSTSCSRPCAATASPTSTSSCRPRISTSTSATTTSGTRRPRPCARSPSPPGSSSCPIRAAPRSTAPRSRCRRATRSAAPGSSRPCSSTSTCPTASSSSTRPPTAPGSGRC